MSKRFIDDTLVIIILGLALITVIALWQFQESPQDAYERGKIDGQRLADSIETLYSIRLLYHTTSFDTFYVLVGIYEDSVLVDTYGETIIIDRAKRGLLPVDSTDPMPVVERLPIILPDTGGVR